jgi:alanine dehydrogenase
MPFMALFLSEQDIRAVLTMDEALDAVETAFRQQGSSELMNVARRRLRTKDTVFNVMFSANQGENLMGAKLYTVSRTRARFVVLLFDGATGALKAAMEADALGQMRTGAASGVATRLLARPDARRLTIFGAGWQARSQVAAICAVRLIEAVQVVGRDPERVRAFCELMRQQVPCPVEPAVSPEEAARWADIIVTATNAHQPVLKGAWLRPGQHINAIGSNVATHSELDADAVRAASRIFVDSLETAKMECGDLLPLITSGELSWSQVFELGEAVVGTRPGRVSEEEITLFESHGIAAEDVSTAARVYSLAKAKGLGKTIDFLD